jgi:hypothetical protein
METINTQFKKLINDYASFEITRQHSKLDMQDPVVLNSIDEIELAGGKLITEGNNIYVNGSELNNSLNEYLEHISSFKSEFDSNLQMPIDQDKLKLYVSEAKRTLEKIESEIIEQNSCWTFKNLFYKDVLVTELDESEITEMSNYFLELKNHLRKLIAHICSILSENVYGIATFERIQLLCDTNFIVAIFYDLKEKGYIKTSRVNLARFFSSTFSDKNRVALKFSTVFTDLKKNKNDKRPSFGKKVFIPDK